MILRAVAVLLIAMTITGAAVCLAAAYAFMTSPD